MASSDFMHFWTLKPIFITLIAFLAPLYLPVKFDPCYEQESKCAYVIIVMAIMWIFEAIPIPATALMPIFLFPMLQVATAKEISGSYLNDTTMLFLGGLIIAVALEESGLHVRISLGVMRIVGAQPIWLMLGLMTTTWFLSMWISNTAATAMMVPIIQAVVKTVTDINKSPYDEEEGQSNRGYEDDSQDAVKNGGKQVPTTAVKLPLSAKKAELSRHAKAFALSVAYGANIGGIATLTGTPPNLVMKRHSDVIYEDYSLNTVESDISFARWMGFAFPMSLITMILAWLWLVIFFLRCGCFKKMDKESKKAVNATLRRQYNALGRISFCEIQVLVVFILLIILWLFRSPPNIDGWGWFFERTGDKNVYVSDSTPCILLGVLLFILPAKLPMIFCWNDGTEKPAYHPILTWKTVNAKLPWGVIILLGGGFAIAKGSDKSGLSKWMGSKLASFAELDEWVMNLIICCVVAGATEFTSNTATANLLMPILSKLAITTSLHPHYLMMSATVACSFAFMLPAATPPNAIVFSTGYLKIWEMVVVGLPMNIIAMCCLTLSVNTWGKAMFEFDDIPEFFRNVTLVEEARTC